MLATWFVRLPPHRLCLASARSGDRALLHSRRLHATTAPQMAFVLGVLGIDNQAGQQGVQGIVLPPAAMDFKAQAPRVRAVQSFRQGEMQLEGWEPLMPTLFLPAAPKSATTWLYGCMDNTFGSDQLCPVNKSASSSEVWAECDKKFFMPAHQCNREFVLYQCIGGTLVPMHDD